MENADKPIKPIHFQDNSLANEADENYLVKSKALIGLTKREYFAGLAMQSIAGIECSESASHIDDIAKRIARRAVKFADELLKQLENQK